MKTRTMIWRGAPALMCVCLIGVGVLLAQAQPPKSNPSNPPPASTNSVPVKAKVPVAKAKAKTTKKSVAGDPPPPLTGAELYSINCERCHQERYPTERTGAQWKTIMLHMQVRANLPPKEAKLILQFLQENSGR